MFSSTLMDPVMAQPFYPADDEVSFDLQSKRDAPSMPHTIHNDNHQEIVDRNLGCINTGAEVETKGRGPMRRRTQVACQRCRKRKIKCSGDPGDGKGCSNCQNVGNTQCHFLRVNSSIVGTKVPASTAAGWPYPPSDMMSQRAGMFAAPRLSNNKASPFLRPAEYELAPDLPNPYGRQPFSIDPSINYEDESSTPYSVQSSSTYMLPNSPQMIMADYSGINWNSKSWGAALHPGRPTGEAMFSDNDAENALGNPAFSCVVSGQGVTANESTVGVAPNSGSLASPIHGIERILPNPTSRNSFSGNNTSPISPEAMSGLPSVHDCKSGNRWLTRCEPRTPMLPASNAPYSTGTLNRGRPIPTSAQDMVFGYLPVSSSNAPSPVMSSHGAFAGLESTTCSAEADEEFRGNADGRSRSFSRDNRRMMSLTGSNTYGYTKPDCYLKYSEPGDSSAESTLITGLPYMRPKRPVTLPQLDEFPGYKPLSDIHTTQVSALSNPGGL
ncbi:hypothetical protein BJX61DRAFT_474687 [Aspergillus egyptiacus]|nr:hypothetical protein BJX61DRAFT_474687 [Aspergillus egyptiacus]